MAFTEREFNGSFDTANNVGLITRTETIQGSLSALTSDSSDLYRFQIHKPSKFGAVLFPGTANANITLFDGNRNIVFSSTLPGTVADGLSSDNLIPGDYFLNISGDSTSNTNYSVSLAVNPIVRAEMSVTINRIKALEQFDTKIPFTSFHKADFFVDRLSIDGSNRTSDVFSSNNDDVRPNFTFRRDVDINKRQLPTVIGVSDKDLTTHDAADINSTPNDSQIRFNFDAVAGVLKPRPNGGFHPPRREGETIVVEGEGISSSDNLNFKTRKARIEFRANYETFTSTSASSLQSLSTKIGKNRSETIIGENRSGILDGRGGHDTLSGMGGHDVLIGGTGSDKLNGGIGRDLLWGGADRDIYVGGSNRDTFVLDLGKGMDVIKDFRNGTDKLGLYGGLSSEILDIVQEGKNVGIYAPNDKLATLQNVRSNQITAADFVQVDFAQIKSIITPYAVV